MPAGRPTKYDDAIVKLIVNGIRAGLTNKDAALVAGINETTLIRWEKKYANFADQLTRARAERSADWLAHIRKAGAKDWRAYAELLDRCAPEYRKTEKHEITGKDGAAIRIEVVYGSPDDHPDHS